MATILVLALVLLGMVLAYWSWALLGPGPEPRVRLSAEPAGSLLDASNVFGNAPRHASGATATGLGITLVGVIAGTAGQPGHALMRIGAKQVVARAGEQLAPGIRLLQVFPDHILLERNGARETLAWPDRRNIANPMATGTVK